MDPIWNPSAERIQAANITAFTRKVKEKYPQSFSSHPSYPELHEWSVKNPELFWPMVWSFCGVTASQKWDSVLIDGHKMPGVKWFLGARLNFAENLLRYRDDHPALIFLSETGLRRALTYHQLYADVSQLASFLKNCCALKPGDRVAGYLPNLPEAVVAMLGTTSLGAIWSSCSPDFGVPALIDRFGQISPTVLFTADGYSYHGKIFDCLDRAKEIVRNVPSIKRVVVVPYLNEKPDLLGFESAVLLNDIINGKSTGDGISEQRSAFPSEYSFEQFPFDHPLYILYSSGTTGAPKCIVHGAGGTLLQHVKELVLHTDLKRHDKIFFYTTTGWMMWNWVISSLSVGASVLLYEGSPLYPSENALFDFVEKEKITIFGTSAKYLSSIAKAGLIPKESHDLSSLQTMLSTGSPLLPESYDFVYRSVKSDICLSSISGGTDIICCFALGNPTLPVYRGQLQALGLGMDIRVFDESGNTLIGVPGELVCASPFPSMPVYFWNDPEGIKYRSAYFDVYPGIWRHGDWAILHPQGSLTIYGRSDAVLNPGGVRIGTAEIYNQLEQIEEISESVVIAQRFQDDERIILFVKLKQGCELSEEWATRVKVHLRKNLSPRHLPAKIIAVPDIPKTINGKVVELAVRDIVHGRPIGNLGVLANPEALEYFRNLPELALK